MSSSRWAGKLSGPERKERARKIKIAVRVLLRTDTGRTGYYTRLAEYFHVSRQRVNQLRVEVEAEIREEIRQNLRARQTV